MDSIDEELDADRKALLKEDSLYEDEAPSSYYQSVKKLFRKFSQDSVSGSYSEPSPINNMDPEFAQ